MIVELKATEFQDVQLACTNLPVMYPKPLVSYFVGSSDCSVGSCRELTPPTTEMAVSRSDNNRPTVGTGKSCQIASCLPLYLAISLPDITPIQPVRSALTILALESLRKDGVPTLLGKP